MRPHLGLLRALALVCLGFLLARPAAAQTAPAAAPAAAPYEVLAVTVEGAADEASASLARQISGLRPGAQVQLPWDPSFSEAVRGLYTRGGYSDASVEVSQVVGQGVFLTVRVAEQPKLASYAIEGLGSSDRNDLADEIPLLRGRAVRAADVERGRIAIQTFLRGKGFRAPTVTVTQTPADAGRVDVVYTVQRGDRQSVADVQFVGNEAFSERTLRRRLKGTPERRWWRFWKRETFNEQAFEEDLANLTSYYQDRGYYGARVVRDSVYTEDDGLVVRVELEEGPRYAIRDVVFEGNTLFTDAQLQQALGVQTGDTYNRTRLDRNLNYSPDHSDVSSLYSDRGYLRFRADPQITVVPGDSLDLYYEVTEGDVYEFGEVTIAGNTRTKEHVIRRELRTIPGQPFSRQAMERSVRELSTLNYFDPASFGAGPALSVNDDDQTVDLTYRLAEKSSDQLELSGGYGGGGTGLILTARVTFSNFSVQNMLKGRGNPLPSGDGQQLALQVQTFGTIQQIYSLSFTEPWFRGRQTPAGFSLSYSNFNPRNGQLDFARGSARVFYRQRLKFPDDYFQTGTDLGLSLYDITRASSGSNQFIGLPDGVSRELTVSQSLTRNALDSPQLPTAGSSLGLTVTVAPPIPGFIQYVKGDFRNAWYTPVGPRLSANIRTQFGYIGSLTGEEVQFQRYLVGGTALEAQGGQGGIAAFGKDLVTMRSYPLEAIGPRRDGSSVGGRILNKYQSEVQWLALQSPQLTVAPYLFLDAANTWDGFSDYDPARLFRSAGVGARLFLPILGLVDVNYGRQIDAFDATGIRFGGDESGQPQWRFQFNLGGSS